MSFALSHHSFVSITGVLDDKENPSLAHAMGSTTPNDHRKRPPLIAHGGVIPLRISTILTLCVFFSLMFILVISFAFMGDDGDEPYFKKTLDDIAHNTPGVSDSVCFKNCSDQSWLNWFTDCFAGRKRGCGCGWTLLYGSMEHRWLRWFICIGQFNRDPR